MSEVIVTRGLPASGKSTWAKAWVAESPDTRVRVNRDDIRFALFGRYAEVDEDIVTAVEDKAVGSAVKAGRDVVIDAMHLKARYVKKWARRYPGLVKVKHFEVPVQVAHDRNQDRAIRGDRSVPDFVIRNLAKRFHIPERGKIPLVDLSDIAPVGHTHKPYTRGLYRAFSFDIDGTLARMTGRSPYDASRYDEDVPDRQMQELFWTLQDAARETPTAFIGLSGRSEDHRAVTEEWLRGHGMELDALFMRPSGDTRNDGIVKSELVDKHISNVYDVVVHFDDRNRVVEALRAKGMKVLQVEPGDF